MSDPITWLALQAIAARLALIRIADGYYTDLGAAPILLDRSQSVGNVTATYVIAGDMPTDLQSSSKRTAIGSMDVTIQYQIAVTPAGQPEREAHRARADIVRALATAFRGEAEGVTTVSLRSASITSAVEPGTSLIIAQVSCVAGLVETRAPA
jgi:hypothetical protein